MTVFEARHAAQGGTTTKAKTGSSAAPRQQDNRTAKARKHQRLAYGQMAEQSAALAARCGSTTEVRHGLSVPTGKPAGMAASGHPCGALRPGQITPGRQVGRPLSPARVRAMPERFVVIERPKNRFIRKGQASTAH